MIMWGGLVGPQIKYVGPLYNTWGLHIFIWASTGGTPFTKPYLACPWEPHIAYRVGIPYKTRICAWYLCVLFCYAYVSWSSLNWYELLVHIPHSFFVSKTTFFNIHQQKAEKSANSVHDVSNTEIPVWASYQIRKIARCTCAGNTGTIFPAIDFKRKPLFNDPGMHHGTCVTHVPWCISGSLIHGGGDNGPGIPSACANRNFTHLVRGPSRAQQFRDNNHIYATPTTN